MKRTFLALALTATSMVAMPAIAADQFTPYNQMPAGVYSSDPHHTNLVWKVSHLGLMNYIARFKSVNAAITFDPKDITKSSVQATIDPKSVETDFVPTAEHDFNTALATQEIWFNAGKFPTITFASTKIETTGLNTGKIHGNLTFLGVTKPVVLNAVFNGAMAEQAFSHKPTLGFSATATLNRSDWGLNTYVPAIGDKVDIIIEAEFAKNN